MVKSLTAIGNSQGIIIPKAVLDLMGLREGDLVNMELRGRELVVTSVGQEERRKFEEAKAAVLVQYEDAFRELAK